MSEFNSFHVVQSCSLFDDFWLLCLKASLVILLSDVIQSFKWLYAGSDYRRLLTYKRLEDFEWLEF